MDYIWKNSNPNILYLVCLFIICGAAAFVGAAPTRIFGHDNFFLLDNGWRIVCGQRPHLDFFSPWGPIMFLVIGLGLTISNASVDGIGYANAIFGLIIGSWTFLLSRGRLSALPRFLLGIYLTLIIIAPFPLGNLPLLSSHAMLYNRYGYALLGLILIECFQPKEIGDKNAGEIIGGISTGTIIAVLLFLKASFFTIAIPIVVASFLFAALSFLRGLGMALSFGLAFFAILSYLRFDIFTVGKAFWNAAGARSQALHMSILSLQLMSQLPTLLIVVAMLFFKIRHVQPAGSWLNDYKFFIWMFLVFASDSLLMISNSQIFAMPLLGVLAILIANQETAEISGNISTKAHTHSSNHYIILVLCALIILPQISFDFIGLLNGVFQKAHFSTITGVVRFTEPHLAPLILSDSDSIKQSNGSAYTKYVNDGVALLRQHCVANDRVLTMDMVNPFPYALKWRPPKGGIAAIAFNYTLSSHFRPSFHAYFGDATIVMLPKHPAQLPFFIDKFYELYIPGLLECYQLYAESDQFWLYKRK